MTYEPADVDVTDIDDTYAITVTNPIVRVRGELGLVKVLVDPDHVVDPDPDVLRHLDLLATR